MRRYLKKDYGDLSRWYVLHGMQVPAEHKLSRFGVIEDNVGAGFLYLTNSSISFIDGLVTNPLATSTDRSKAIYKIITRLNGRAKRVGAKAVLGFTLEPTIMERVLMHGFKQIGQYWLFEKEM